MPLQWRSIHRNRHILGPVLTRQHLANNKTPISVDAKHSHRDTDSELRLFFAGTKTLRWATAMNLLEFGGFQ